MRISKLSKMLNEYKKMYGDLHVSVSVDMSLGDDLDPQAKTIGDRVHGEPCQACLGPVVMKGRKHEHLLMLVCEDGEMNYDPMVANALCKSPTPLQELSNTPREAVCR